MDQESIQEKDGWRFGFSQEEIDRLDTSKLSFALEETRAYLENISERNNRLANRGFIIIGFLGSFLVLLFSVAIEVIGRSAVDEGYVGRPFWPTVVLIALLFACWLVALLAITKVILVPRSSYPLGIQPQNILRKEVLSWSLNALIFKEMYWYKQRISENKAQNESAADWVTRCIYLVFFVPAAALIIWFAVLQVYRLP